MSTQQDSLLIDPNLESLGSLLVKPNGFDEALIFLTLEQNVYSTRQPPDLFQP